MTAQNSFLQLALVMLYPLFTSVALSLWGIFRIARAALPRVNKIKRTGYILLLGLCIFPGSFWLFMLFTERCYGQGSGGYNWSHQLLCGHEVVLGMPWWGIVLYSADILVLLWSVLRNTKDLTGNFVTFAVPLLYFFILRVMALVLLQRIENTAPFSP
jgi:hypothetical protein